MVIVIGTTGSDFYPRDSAELVSDPQDEENKVVDGAMSTKVDTSELDLFEQSTDEEVRELNRLMD